MSPIYQYNGNPSSKIAQYFLDVADIIVAYSFAYYLASQITFLHGFSQYTWILLVYIPLWIFIMYIQGMYDMTTFIYYDRILRSVLIAALISGSNTAAAVFFIKDQELSRIFFATFIVSSTLIVLTERYFYTYISKRYFKHHARNIVVIGTSAITEKFIHFMHKTELKLNIVKRIRLGEGNEFSDLTSRQTYEYLNKLLKETVVDEVVFTVPPIYLSDIEKYALLCEEMGITVSMVLELYDFRISQIDLSSIGTLPMLTFHSVCLSRHHLMLKRLVDIIGSIAGILVTAIIAIVVIPAIKLDSDGPALFVQKRVGVNRRVFNLYKFRTMIPDAEGKKQELMAQNNISGDLMFKIKNDPRITRVGNFLRKSSIDELPQFFNVLKGEMSLVGTRPPTLDEVPKYENHHWRRMSVKPGMTGLWQISGRSSITNFEDVVKLDTQYIDQWSVWLDIKILLKTILVVFGKRGAS